ncbi:HlyD family type I secretion periplasmic adaptor subunit [Psychromarinibacter sp. C21-152]|uniref:Membrane fusion protein (MFP) family protein n=1 Tax=Psychromarinibacter sediminicola TaxID=3033385 RepID=A0AAE3T6J2_9RHOB|nr:HlyD family type I secretion periplasmic adaptor subunit [Psychromarinibacter sediminicola]MDF0599345.1 HlyD family type I secretion periplasmic adaptor subunit [Psychromarinibacter sediminicola]
MSSDPLSPRRYLVIGAVALATLVLGFGGWAVFSQIAGAVVASGRVEVDQNRQVVQHPDGGVVEEIAVEEGEYVEAGEILVRLDPTLLRSELAIVESQLFELMARRGRLEAERDDAEEITFDPELLAAAADRPEVQDLIDGQQSLFEARKETLAREIEQLEKRKLQIETQVEGIVAQQSALERQHALVSAELEKQEGLLSGGLAQGSTVLSLQREESRLTGTMGELTAQRGLAQERITEIDIEILKLATTRRETANSELTDLKYRELELAEQRQSLLERLARLDIRAPVSGVVYGKTVFTPRSVIRPADPVLYLIPQDRPLVIMVRVSPTDIDEVFAGQEVVLRFSAFDSRNTPELTGTVVKISADAFTDEQAGLSYYRAELELPEAELDRIPEGLTLIPGMPVEAFIRTADRTPLAYLVKPLTDYFSRAFRES